MLQALGLGVGADLGARCSAANTEDRMAISVIRLACSLVCCQHTQDRMVLSGMRFMWILDRDFTPPVDAHLQSTVVVGPSGELCADLLLLLLSV